MSSLCFRKRREGQKSQGFSFFTDLFVHTLLVLTATVLVHNLTIALLADGHVFRCSVFQADAPHPSLAVPMPTLQAQEGRNLRVTVGPHFQSYSGPGKHA